MILFSIFVFAATIRPESLLNDGESERLLRDGVAATVAAVFAAGTGMQSLLTLLSYLC